MLKNLFVIRHGEAEHLIGDRLTGGWTNSSLTKLGQKQAASLGGRLKELIGEKEFALYCSDLSRARQTAEIMAHYLGKSPVAHADLRELGNGDAANMPSQEARKIARPQTQPTYDWVHYPNGESWRDLNNRVFKFMASLKDKPEDTVVIVSHRKTILAIIQLVARFE